MWRLAATSSVRLDQDRAVRKRIAQLDKECGNLLVSVLMSRCDMEVAGPTE
jgi:hypothetical protein